jgi:hypothetical protein
MRNEIVAWKSEMTHATSAPGEPTMETKVTEHYFQYETNKYFRGNAHSLRMGSFGEKKDPIGAKAYLDVQGTIKPEYLASRVKYNTTTKIDWSQTNKAEVEAEGAFKFFGLNINTAVNGTFDKAKNAKLEMISFTIDEGPLQKMLNEDADGARKYLADEGNDGRVVSEVWVVTDGELSEHFSTSGSVSVSANAVGNSLDVTAKGGKHGSQSIRLEEGVVFAYKLHKVKDWNRDKTRIENLEADWKGIG